MGHFKSPLPLCIGLKETNDKRSFLGGVKRQQAAQSTIPTRQKENTI